VIWRLPSHEQRELDLDDVRARIPWGGRSPRELTLSLTNVENSSINSKPATVDDNFTDPAQVTLFLKGSPHGS